MMVGFISNNFGMIASVFTVFFYGLFYGKFVIFSRFRSYTAQCETKISSR